MLQCALTLLLLLQLCFYGQCNGPRESILPLGDEGLATYAFIANLQEKLLTQCPTSVARGKQSRRKIVIASTGNSITAAGYLFAGQQFADVLVRHLQEQLSLDVEHRNMGVAAANCGYNWLCTLFQGDGILKSQDISYVDFIICVCYIEDIIIDANPMKWSSHQHSEEACETMLRSELSLKHRPIVVSMDVSIPRTQLENSDLDLSETIAKMSPYQHEALAVLDAARYILRYLRQNRQGTSVYYHDDIHPSVYGHEILGSLLFQIIMDAACNKTIDPLLAAHWAGKTTFIDPYLTLGKGHCVLADDFSGLGRRGSSGVRVISNNGWSLAHSGTISTPDSTAGVMRDGKYSWMANIPGSVLELELSALSICIVYYSNHYHMGMADVYLDGTLIRTIDAHFEGYSWNRHRGLNNMRWVLGKHRTDRNHENNSVIPAGPHTIRIVISNQTNMNTLDPRHEFQIIGVLYFW